MSKQAKRERQLRKAARERARRQRRIAREQREQALRAKRSDDERRARMRELDDASPIRASASDLLIADTAAMRRETSKRGNRVHSGS